MSERVISVGSVVINVVDFERSKKFWGAVLGSEVAFEIPEQFCWLKPQHEGGISVALQSVEHPTEGRNRVHLDASVADVDDAIRRITELGGALLETHEHAGFVWNVMADPEGNEFCITPADSH